MCTVGDDGVKGERWVFAVVLVLILVLNEMKMGGGGGCLSVFLKVEDLFSRGLVVITDATVLQGSTSYVCGCVYNIVSFHLLV